MAYLFWGGVALITGWIILTITRKRKFEKGLSEATRKSRKLLGSASLYIDQTNKQTIIRYDIANKHFTVLGFLAQEILKAGESYLLLDHENKKLCTCSNETTPPIRPTKIPFYTITNIELLQKGKSKTRTGGGISPISIAGYRVISVTKRRLYEVEHILLRISYTEFDKQRHCDVTVFRGLIETKKSKYERIIDNAIEVKNRLEQLR